MGPKKVTGCGEPKRKLVRATMDVKKAIVSGHEAGVRVSDLAKQFGMAKSSICTILKNKDAIKKADVAKGVNFLTKQRPQTIEQMEKLLLVWMNEKQLAGVSVASSIICEKARRLHDELSKGDPGAGACTDIFKASRGWLEKFKRRSGVRNVVRRGKAKSCDRETAERHSKEFSEYVKAKGFLPQQVFNCGETALYWKKMPGKTSTALEGTVLAGPKRNTDRLTLLLGGNASGDLKLKPLLVYHSENPKFKRDNVMKSKMTVMWRANSEAVVTLQFFIEWIHEVFAPTVRMYLQEQNLPAKCLLVVDNAPAHPPHLEDELADEFDFITVKFLPNEAAPLIQPMDRLIPKFKKIYTRAVFQECLEVVSDTGLAFEEFWKDHFNILLCSSIVDKAWGQVSGGAVNWAWRGLWPECVADAEDLGRESDTVMEDIVYLRRSLGLEVDGEDVAELVEERRNDVTAEEQEQVPEDRLGKVTGEMSSEEEGREDVPGSLVNEMCAKWGEVQSFVARYHPDKAESNCIANLFNDNVMQHFRKIAKRKEERLLVGQTSGVSPEQLSGVVKEEDGLSKQ